MNKISLKITTPEKVVYEAEVDQVTLPTADGEITILPNHIPLISLLRPGELIAKIGLDIIALAMSGGFLEFSNNNLIILADTAERVEDIDLLRAEEARQRAESLRQEKQIDEAEFAQLAAKVEKELARIKVARKYRHAGRPAVSGEHLAEQDD